MSDPFDPDAWPRSSGGSSSGRDEEADDFNPFAGAQDDDDYDNSVFGGSPDAYGSPPGSTGAPRAMSNAGFDDEDDDDYSTTGSSTSGRGAQYAEFGSGRSTGRTNDFDDDFRDEFEDDYDDYAGFGNDNAYDDFDDDFDREPSDGGGSNTKRILMIVAAVLFAGLIGGGVLKAVSGGGGGNDQASNTTETSAPANQDGGTDDGTDDGGDQTTDTTTTPDTTGTTGTTAAPNGGGAQAATPPADLKQTLDAALTAWGKFAVDGNLDDVKTYFAPNTKQFNRFQLDAEAISASPPGGQPIKVSMPSPQFLKTDDNNWTARGQAVWARSGELTQNFNWEIRMTRSSDRQPWQIISVRQF
jgi:hypothetical protein